MMVDDNSTTTTTTTSNITTTTTTSNINIGPPQQIQAQRRVQVNQLMRPRQVQVRAAIQQPIKQSNNKDKLKLFTFCKESSQKHKIQKLNRLIDEVSGADETEQEEQRHQQRVAVLARYFVGHQQVVLDAVSKGKSCLIFLLLLN
jgi:hypothetical protein